MEPFPDPHEMTLAGRAREGCTVSFGELVHRHHGSVFGFLLTLTRHRQDAEDLTQDTFLRAWKKFHRYDPAQPLLPWLFTLARRQSIAVLRKKRPLPEDLPYPAEPEATPPLAWIWEAARKELTADAYSAVWLHYAEDLSIRQIAGILGKREGAVKVILHRARKTLEESIRKKAPGIHSLNPSSHES